MAGLPLARQLQHCEFSDRFRPQMCLGIPGRIESITGADPLERTARVNFGGVLREVSLVCVPEAKPGDYVIVHAGMAISVLDETEAHTVLGVLSAMSGDAPDAPAASNGL